ncbi:MAG: hypothetical protein GY820_00640 [Gammaproteobacteria bacterium]|nr:hypothetical protein [Gammaproteobacteria bacterium]
MQITKLANDKNDTKLCYRGGHYVSTHCYFNKVMLHDGMIRSPQGRLRAADSQRMSQYAPSMALYFLVEPNETRSNYLAGHPAALCFALCRDDELVLNP